MMLSTLVLLTGLAATPTTANVPDRCAAAVQGYLLAADATNRLLALEHAEHEAGIYNPARSQRLVLARSRSELIRRSLVVRGCSAVAFTPPFGRYLPPARACAAVEGGKAPEPDFAGCDPFAWKA